MKKVIFMSLLALTTIQCGGSGNGGGGIPGAGLPELTAEQKSKVRSFNSAIDTVSAIKTSKMGTASTNPIFPTDLNTPNPPPQFDKAQQELIEKLNWAETNHYCNSHVSLPNSNDINEASHASISIAGFDCPMSYQMTMNSTVLGQTESSISLQIATSEKFVLNEVTDTKQELHLGLDVTEYTNQLKFHVSGSANPNGLSMNFNGTGTMTAKSLTAGDVSTNLAAHAVMSMRVGSNDSMNMTLNLNLTITQKFSDFSTVGYMTTSLQTSNAFDGSSATGTGGYFINGKVVTADEFENVFGNYMSELPLDEFN